MSDEKPGVTLNVAPAAGRPGRFVAVAVNGVGELHRDTLDLNSAAGRKRFVTHTLAALKEKSSHEKLTDAVLDAARKYLDNQLLAFAAVPPGSAPQAGGELVEVDVRCVVRPELFHTPEVSGVTVGVITAEGDKLVPHWRTYLRWGDGKREAIDRPPVLTVPGGGRLFISPDPGDPTPGEAPPWSAAARKHWQAGTSAPDPAAVFRQLCERVAYFLDLGDDKQHTKGSVAVLALWVLLTYAYPAWDVIPYLYVGGPMNSGKSRLLDVLARLAFRPLVSSNLTAPVLFRTLHARGGTLFYDEAERLRQSTPDVAELNSIFLAGNRRGGTATRLEPVGDGFRSVQFDVYGPKVLACIAGLPPTLASRCISFRMFRAAANSEKPKRRLDADPETWAKLRDDLHALALDYGATWIQFASRVDVVPSALSNRNFELWQPLLALASWLQTRGAEKLLTIVQEYAQTSAADAQDDSIPEGDEMLLEALAEAVRKGEHPTPREILTAARARSADTFEKWQEATVTRRFKNYGIPTPTKSNGVRRFNVSLKMLQRIQTHYGIDLGCEEETTPKTDPTRP